MKILLLTVLSFFATAQGLAKDNFPGLKTVLTEAEWKRAGLDRLSPDQIGVIDAALIRHHADGIQQHRTELTAARAAAPASTEADATSRKRGFLERFGLPASDGADWRDVPPLRATVTEWVSVNRFKLDNDQVWEGMEPITYELVGKPIEIHARPSRQFALTVDGKNTMLRVKRVR
jgi:hypothetical protein